MGAVGANLHSWLLHLVKQPSPVDDDGFPEPLGSQAALTSFLDPPCLVVYSYFATALLASAAWFVYRAAFRCHLLRASCGCAPQTRSQATRRVYCGGAAGGSVRGSLAEPLLPHAHGGSGGGAGMRKEPPRTPPRALRPDKPPRVPLLAQRLTDSKDRTITFVGYTDSCVGTVASWLVPATSGMFCALFAAILYDYYYGCEWSWPQQLCYIGTFPLTGSFDANSHAFFVTWTLGTCWLGLLILGRGGRRANLFRLHAPLRSCKYVQVTVQEKRANISSGYSHTLAGRDKLRKAFVRFMRRATGASRLPGGVMGLSGGQSETVPLRWGEQVQTYFIEFRCVCYIIDPARGEDGGFIQYEASASQLGGYAAFAEIFQAGGLRHCSAGGKDAASLGADEMYRRAGPNRIPFEVELWGAALAEEFSTFFFLYQFSIYAVCLWYSYWHFTVLALCIAFGSGLFNVQIRISNQREIKRMMETHCVAEVQREGHSMHIDAEDIVPGDIVRVRGDAWLVPCDLLLLRGAAVCDESTLTGESAPVQRMAPGEPLGPLAPGGRVPAKHALIAGTTVLQASGEECWAIATHTGIQTQKGQLLLQILYPPKLLFKYDEQLGVAFTLLICYACFVMLATMQIMYARYAADQELPITATWATGVFTCSCVLPTMLHVVLSVGHVVAAQRLKVAECGIFSAAPKRIALAGKVRVACFDKTGTLTTNGLDFFGVHCVRPQQLSAAAAPAGGEGPFDGWVARAALGLAGATPPLDPPELEAQVTREGFASEVQCCLAGAHSLSPFDGGAGGLVGNAVEASMFRASGWTLMSHTEVACASDAHVRGSAEPQRMRILRRFDFSHATMTMSAIVELAPSGSRGVVCKGSFDQVAARCLPSSVPANCAAVAQAHSFAGKYVLAIASKPLPSTSAGAEMPRWREDVERDLVLLGLLLFENPLRPDTKETLARLREGEVRPVMITGDAAGTAICIAKEAGLVAPGVPVLLGDLTRDDVGGSRGAVAWKCFDEDLAALNEALLGSEWLAWRWSYKRWREGSPGGPDVEVGAAAAGASGGSEPSRAPSRSRGLDGLLSPRRSAGGGLNEEANAGCRSQLHMDDEYTFSTADVVLSRLFEWCELAVTQRAYEWLAKTQCSPELRRVLLGSRQASLKKGRALGSGRGSSTLACELLTNIRIFARMTPAGKVSVVEGLMHLGLITSMCGDGGNDSGALRAAHVGVALSGATSATVVAPFTTNRASIAPVADLLREGRGALATSFASYKYCVHYGLLNSTFRFTKYYHGFSQSMAAAYLQDVGGFLSFSWAMGLSRPAATLVGERPTSSLFSPTTVGSVVGLWAINSFFMRVGLSLAMAHRDFVPFPAHLVRVTQWWKMSRNWENTTMFFMYTFQLFWSAVVYSFGHHFRRAWYANVYLLLLSLCGLGFLSVLLVSRPNGVTRAFHLVYEPVSRYEPWTHNHPCPAMPFDLRGRLLGLVVVNLAMGALWEKVIISGLVGRLLRDRWRFMSKHITLRL